MDDHFYIKIGHYNTPALALVPWQIQAFLFHRTIQNCLLFLYLFRQYNHTDIALEMYISNLTCPSKCMLCMEIGLHNITITMAMHNLI